MVGVSKTVSFDMKLHRYVKAGFVSSLIFQGSRRKIKFGYFATFWQFSQKRYNNLFIYFICSQRLGADIDPTEKRYISFSYSEYHFLGRKVQGWLMFPYLSILASLV